MKGPDQHCSGKLSQLPKPEAYRYPPQGPSPPQSIPGSTEPSIRPRPNPSIAQSARSPAPWLTMINGIIGPA
ncbi:hypothetical protein BJ508DRAFT_50997 [Ascobolus immersus RN42]|uniref:Uncharacterized protein n=1 Tax=Ascobolus immersus RN42 TaxID=1160509 RepID=A0A3N4IDF4_ASCIM|nr:hypothetical protein BJ508DRAFT_50997 [Ascobolus immersus RN42]